MRLSCSHLFNFLQFGFLFIALIWKFDFAPFMVLIIAILNDGETIFTKLCVNIHLLIFWPLHSLNTNLFVLLGTIMTISKDRVKPSPQPDSWKLKEIFATGVVLGGYLALMTVIFFWAMKDTNFFSVCLFLMYCSNVKISFVDHILPFSIYLSTLSNAGHISCKTFEGEP